jgi:non-specific serine/threonine protein kinase
MLRAARTVNDRTSEVEALYSLGFLHGIDRDYDAARNAYAESRDIASAIGDQLGEVSASMGIALADWLDGRFGAARDGVLATLPVFQSMGDRYGYFSAVGVLARAQQSLGEVAEARERGLEHLGGAIEIGDRTMTAMALYDLASLDAQEHQLERALLLDGASRAIVNLVGGGAPATLAGLQKPEELAVEAGMSSAEINAVLSRGAALSLDEAIALARGG